MIANRLV